MNTSQHIEHRAQFDFIRYANCWEDADVLLPALRVSSGGRYLSIGSAGDNTFALLAAYPDRVVAVDINPAQLACIYLRRAAFASLSHEELLRFLGVSPDDDRLSLYLKIKKELPAAACHFWDCRRGLIRQGVIHAGKFEGYFRFFRTRVLPLIHSRRTVARLFEPAGQKQRIAFYRGTWNTFRWRLLFRLFFSRRVMGLLGRDPEFFQYVETDVAGRIFARAEYALTVLPTSENPYLEYILTGNFRRALPYYLRPEHFDSIRANLDKLEVLQGNLAQVFTARSKDRFDGFNLSDIFEYMSYEQYTAELRRILRAAAPGARLVYWNMLADRARADEFADRIRFLDEEAKRLHQQDKAFFYKALLIGEV
ncbi:MAG: DUF3419 family protein [Candidatus Omnitrophica bacterium]|nr:DUF3419 family protein [Candidatus Omnitrophota bacterium]